MHEVEAAQLIQQGKQQAMSVGVVGHVVTAIFWQVAASHPADRHRRAAGGRDAAAIGGAGAAAGVTRATFA